MSTFLIEPGAKLADRYRLDQVVNETGGARRWKATDETLARPVAVWTFAEGFPRTSEVVRAARATSRVPDARVTQVFDADDTAPIPYVVEEWVLGSSLAELLSQGPMEPERAAGLVAEAAEAIAAAHASGLHHLCLTPDKLMWSSGGAVKVTGIGVDAALIGAHVADPAAADAQGLGNLLYAALTAHWPTGSESGLRPAPQGPMGPYPPDQIRRGVTEPLATITTRAALPHLAGQMVPGPPITSPADFCAAMAEVPRLIPLPVSPAEAAPTPEPGTSRRTGEFDTADSGPRQSTGHGASPRGAEQPPPPTNRAGQRSGRGSRGNTRKVLIGAVALAVFAAVVTGAWTLGSMMRTADDDEAAPGPEATEDVPDSTDLEVLQISDSDGFDPLGDHSEHGDNAPLAYDGDSSTSWSTEGYMDEMGVRKSGVGLLLDLGESREVHEVDLTVPEAEHEVQIRIGDDHSGQDDATLDANLPPAWEGTADGSESIDLDEATAGQYVVIWFTGLPQVDDRYRGSVHEVELRGT